jgi:MoaA/NifB/PqqE/SkfB family radical SAM enzyme
MKSNHKQLEDFVEFGKKYEFNSITFTPIRGSFGNENIFDLQDREALAHISRMVPDALRKAKEYGIRLNNWLPGTDEGCGCAEDKNNSGRKGTETNSENSRIEDAKNRRMMCYAPWQRLLIDCEGPVRPFGFCESKYVGDVNTMSLSEIWNGEGMRYYRRKIASGDYQDLCRPVCISGQVRDKICRII